MQAIRFVLTGKLAHFRRFYTNSSSLTYPIPPPPTIRGLLGAALGLGPEYTQEFANWRFGVQIAAPWRFLFQTANYLKIKKGEPNLAGGEHTQIPLQFIVPQQLGDRIRYEIVALGAESKESNKVAEALKKPHFPLALGPAYALAQIEEINFVQGTIQDSFEGAIKGPLIVKSIIKLQGPGRLLRDRYPLKLAKDRTLLMAADLAIEAEGKPVAACYKGDVFATDSDAWSLVG